eukprot:1317349-Amphidinium_carterae.1
MLPVVYVAVLSSILWECGARVTLCRACSHSVKRLSVPRKCESPAFSQAPEARMDGWAQLTIGQGVKHSVRFTEQVHKGLCNNARLRAK